MSGTADLAFASVPGITDVQLGGIIVAALLLAALIIGGIGGGGPSQKEIAEEARKRLLFKIADERATGQFEAMKKHTGSIGKLLVVCLVLAGIGYVVVTNMAADSPGAPAATTVVPATTMP